MLRMRIDRGRLGLSFTIVDLLAIFQDSSSVGPISVIGLMTNHRPLPRYSHHRTNPRDKSIYLHAAHNRHRRGSHALNNVAAISRVRPLHGELRSGVRFAGVPEKTAFDQSPTRAEIAIARRQGPNAMHMFRQHDPGINMERVTLPRTPHRVM